MVPAAGPDRHRRRHPADLQLHRRGRDPTPAEIIRQYAPAITATGSGLFMALINILPTWVVMVGRDLIRQLGGGDGGATKGSADFYSETPQDDAAMIQLAPAQRDAVLHPAHRRADAAVLHLPAAADGQGNPGWRRRASPQRG